MRVLSFAVSYFPVCLVTLLVSIQPASSLLAKPSTTSVCAIQPQITFGNYESSTLGGLLGQRYRSNISGRILSMSESDILEGFQRRPGPHPWIGEHVGKWLHAATLSWQNTGDARLRIKIDRVVKALVATQEADGYLGTYAPDRRMGKFGKNSWDVWVHKYAILGLLSYHNSTGSTEALTAARRAGEHLLYTFAAGKRDINQTSEHAGMASTSALEPIVQLFRQTGDRRYLDFAREIIGAWDAPTGAGVVSNILRDQTVLSVGNKKAYEMLSCLVGICEFYQETGEPQYLKTCELAWEDIVRNHLYITGSGSVNERWTTDRHLPIGSEDKICETCVTVTWMQLNLKLFQTTGDSRYMDQIERTVFNQLLGAQKSSGDEFCYYTPLEGVKPYSRDMTCCFSSGVRGIAMLPSFVTTTSARPNQPESIQVNLYGEGDSELELSTGRKVHLRQRTDYPSDGYVRIEIDVPNGPQTFRLQLRIPEFATEARWSLNDVNQPSAAPVADWLDIHREWSAGDVVELDLPMKPRLVAGDQDTSGRVAVLYGPLVMAADLADNPGHTLESLRSLVLRTDGTTASTFRRISATQPVLLETEIESAVTSDSRSRLVLTPFYTAGQTGKAIETWFHASKKADGANLFQHLTCTQLIAHR